MSSNLFNGQKKVHQCDRRQTVRQTDCATVKCIGIGKLMSSVVSLSVGQCLYWAHHVTQTNQSDALYLLNRQPL